MNVIIRPGELRHTLYLQQATPSYGNPGSWSNVATRSNVRCKIETISGSEPTAPSGEHGERRLRLTMRYRSDVTYDKRFSDGNSPARIFDIVSIDNVNEMNHKLIVEVIEHHA